MVSGYCHHSPRFAFTAAMIANTMPRIYAAMRMKIPMSTKVRIQPTT